MSAYLDIIILLLVVVMVFVKLKGLLGTRPENDTEISQENAAKVFDVLMQKHDQKQKKQPLEAEASNGLGTEALQKLNEPERTLHSIPGFDRDKFISGAKRAFEVIVTSFAKGDITTLENLVGNSLLKKFKDIVGQRKNDGIVAETDFIGFNEAIISDAKITKANLAKISVKFVSEQVNILRNNKGEVLEGDENFIQSITDVWTFERALNSTSPNWLLVSTKK